MTKVSRPQRILKLNRPKESNTVQFSLSETVDIFKNYINNMVKICNADINVSRTTHVQCCQYVHYYQRANFGFEMDLNAKIQCNF